MPDWIASCACKGVSLTAISKPMISSACYCADCQKAGHDLERLPGAAKLVRGDGGTPMVLFRKDLVRIVEGEGLLREHRLNRETPTRRLVASCCNTPMALDFTKGFWLSVYADRLGPNAPPLEMRVMVKDRPQGVALPNDVPNGETFPGGFMIRLLSNWAAMGFRRAGLPSYPAIDPQ